MFGFGFRIGLGLRPGGGSAPVSAITALTVLGPGALPDGADAADANGWVAKAALPFDAGRASIRRRSC